MSKLKLYPYQQEALNSVIKAFENKIHRQLLVLPTGSGKTVLFAAIVKHLDKKTLILAPRNELIKQAYDKFKKFYPKADIGIWQGKNSSLNHQIIISSIQTCSQPNRLEQLKKEGFSVLVVDECHHATSNSYQNIIKELGFSENSDQLFIGVTATPIRSDKQDLSNIFQQTVYSISIEELIHQGYLSPVKARRINTQIKIKKVSTRLGDFALEELATAVNIPERNSFIVKKWREHALSRKTIVFCTNVQHCKDLEAEFRKHGIKAAAVWGNMPHDQRKKIIKKFKRGHIKVIISCSLLTEGFDCESIACVAMARPTKSKGLYGQMAGRGLRIDRRKNATKKDCLILDFTDTHHNLSSIASMTDVIKDIQIIQDSVKIPNHTNNRTHKEQSIKTNRDIDEEFDPLNNSKYFWIAVLNEHSLTGVNGYEIVISKRKTGYVAYMFLHNKQEYPIKKEPVSLQECKNICENFATKTKNFAHAQTDSPWVIAGKSLPATPAQVNALNNYGIYEKNLSKTEAGSKIRKYIAFQNHKKRHSSNNQKKKQFVNHKTLESNTGKFYRSKVINNTLQDNNYLNKRI